MAAMLPVPLLWFKDASSCSAKEETRQCHLSWVQDCATTNKAECSVVMRSPSRSDAAMNQQGGFDPARSRFYEIKLSPCVTQDESSESSLLHNTILVLPNLLTPQECKLLVANAERILDNAEHIGVKTEKWTLYSHFTHQCQHIMEVLLQKHTLAFIQQRLPDVAEKLCLCRNDNDEQSSVAKGMEYYWDDPVIIKYTAGNRLAPHEDMRQLTIVVPLNPSKDFPLVGGGTRFWPQGTIAPEDEHGGVSVMAPAGSGIVFNGDITHSGNSVLEGTRFVLMTSINLDDSDDEKYHDEE